jgi:hypothetical protein
MSEVVLFSVLNLNLHEEKMSVYSKIFDANINKNSMFAYDYLRVNKTSEYYAQNQNVRKVQ